MDSNHTFVIYTVRFIAWVNAKVRPSFDRLLMVLDDCGCPETAEHTLLAKHYSDVVLCFCVVCFLSNRSKKWFVTTELSTSLTLFAHH